ncbi:hypothetical protein CFE70_007953 [Pyrenophora teres f. teres 0-1]|uniref:Uncharacterized protein n=1 Tax=Pyrenophora teres f. teres (strain 0-1) TaxID=861557 RepID=E3RQ43_PYRTT|nr:hypothetical protein PTT_10804 [Pyrenophora teres f. teres 0-1]
MLSIQPSKPQKATPNLLPFRINHNGPINSTQQYWKPNTDEKGTQHAYFRGRHLYGKSIPLPENYTGAVLHMTEKLLPQQRAQAQPSHDDDDDEDGDDAEVEESMPVEVKIAEQVGEFDEVVIWGHGGEVDGNGDIFVKGINEWIGFAESMHADEDEDVGTTTEQESKRIN